MQMRNQVSDTMSYGIAKSVIVLHAHSKHNSPIMCINTHEGSASGTKAKTWPMQTHAHWG